MIGLVLPYPPLTSNRSFFPEHSRVTQFGSIDHENMGDQTLNSYAASPSSLERKQNKSAEESHLFTTLREKE